MKPRRYLPVGTLALVLLVPSLASAQAWVPPKGEGFLTLNFQSSSGKNHLFSTPVLGSKSVDIGRIDGRALVLGGDFGLTDKLAVSASLALVGGRYLEGGRNEETGPGHHDLPGDDGSWQDSLQDLRASLRYMQPKGLWVFTPSVGVVVPLRDYPTLGHAALGRGLNELQLGLGVGRVLYKSGRPRAYLQGGYRYAFFEKVGDTSLNLSNLRLELGYLAHPKLTLRSFADRQISHGGIDWAHGISGPEEFAHHDQLAATEWLLLGVGLSIPVREGVDFFASVARVVEGANTIESTTVSIGTTWGFQAPGSGRTKIRFPEPGR